MSNAREERNRRQSSEGAAPEKSTASGEPSYIPFTPRRGLLIILGLALVLLLAGMLTLYFKTVYPYRNAPHIVETDTQKLTAK